MHRYLQNNICYLKSPISPWSRPRQATLFWAFFLSMTYIFILQKIVAWRDRLQLFCTFAVNLVKFSAPMSFNFFLCKIWVITNSKSAANITLWVYWMRNRGLLSKTFCTLFNQLSILTYSNFGTCGIFWTILDPFRPYLTTWLQVPLSEFWAQFFCWPWLITL